MFKRMFAAGVFVCVVAMGAAGQYIQPAYSIAPHLSGNAAFLAVPDAGSIIPVYVHSPGPGWGSDWVSYLTAAQSSIYETPNVPDTFGPELPAQSGSNGFCAFSLGAYEVANYSTREAALLAYFAMQTSPKGKTAYMLETPATAAPFIVVSQHQVMACQ